MQETNKCEAFNALLPDMLFHLQVTWNHKQRQRRAKQVRHLPAHDDQIFMYVQSTYVGRVAQAV
jgi:hypothetical protein